MANLVLAFAEILAGAVLVDAGIKGDSIANVVKGKATQHPIDLGGSSSTGAASGVGAASAASTTAGGYVNPFAKATGLHVGRTDMGVDASMTPGSPILAPGDSKYVGKIDSWYAGQPLVVYQLLSGPDSGKFYYISEQITGYVTGTVKAGQQLATYASSGTALEMGWAAGPSGQTLAQATTGYTEGQVTAAGSSFRAWLKALGAPV